MNNKIPEWQAGFRENRSTVDNIFVPNVVINSRLREKNGKLYAVSVDLKNSFPSVPHNLLWEKLHKIGVSSKIIIILKDLYSKANMVVKPGEGTSEKCNNIQGVLQGETLSPISYSLFISDLEDFLKNKGLREVQLDKARAAIILAFADDMILLSESPIYQKKLLKYLEEYFDLNKLELNMHSKNKINYVQKRLKTKVKQYSILL